VGDLGGVTGTSGFGSVTFSGKVPVSRVGWITRLEVLTRYSSLILYGHG
jgi:hypothetical protein